MKKNYFKLKGDLCSGIRSAIVLLICIISIGSINAQSISKNNISSSGSMSVPIPSRLKKTPSISIAKKPAINNAGRMANAVPINYVYVGSFNVGDGPCWGDGPTTYTALEAAALVFGGSSSDYAISVDPSTTDSSTITHTAYLDGYGDITFINTPAAEDFKEGTTYTYPAFSAYVKDNTDGNVFHANCNYSIGTSRTNYVWRISQPSITCPGDIVTVIDPSSCGAVVNFSATTTNLTAPVINYSTAPGSLFPIGTTTVTVTATGTEGTVSCSFQVTVNSNISVDPVNNIQLCNGENTTAISFSGGNATANYYWTNDNATIGLAATGTGNIASFTATNTTNTDITANITVTPTVGAGTMDLITNGGFETNDLTGWSIFGYAGTSGCDQGFATYTGNYDPCNFSATTCGGTSLDFTAPEGTYGISTSFDGQGPINKELRQSITLPTNLTSANLQFNDEYYVDLQDACAGCTGVRVLDVNVLDATGANVLATLYNLTLTPNANYCQAWTPKNLDVLSALQAYAGQNVILSYEITIPESFTGPGWYALDNVHLNVNTGCSGAPTSFAITVKATPAAPVVTDQTFCNAATVANLTATGTNIQWYADTTSATSLDPTTALATGTYYVTQNINSCESVRTAVNVVVNTTPIPTAADQTFCNATTVANLIAAGTSLQWYDVATGGTALDATTALSTATYYVSQTLNACEGPRTAVNVTVNTTANPTATDLTFCNAATAANLTATGSNLQWYDVANGGTALDPTTTLATGTYYVSQTLNMCEGPRTAVNVTVVTSSVDTVNDIQLCNGENTAAINFTGSNSSATYSWTNDNATIGLAASGTGNIASFTATNTTNTDIIANITVTPTVAAGTIDLITNGGFETNDLTGWSIFGYAGTSGCDQGFTTYSGNYDPCGYSTIACSGTPLDFTAPEGTYGISASFDGQGPINKELRQNITLPANLSQANLQFNDEFYVDLQDYCASCTGVRVLDVNILDATGTNVLATLYNLTLTPNANYCQAWTPKNLDVLSALQAYAGQNVILSYEITIPESFTGPGWYALDNVHLNVNSGCSGAPTSFAITVKATPAAPVVTDQTFCNAATVANLTATGTNIQWYADTTSATSLDPTTALATGTYYVTQNINSCESVRTAVNVVVNTTPIPTAADQTFCNAATVANLIATGTSLQWYDVATGGTALDTTTALTTATYYVSQTLNACEGPRVAVNVTVNITASPTAADQTFCTSGTVSNLTATGTNLQWYDVANGGTALDPTTTLATGTYYVSQTLNMCEGTRTAINVTVNTTANPTAADQSFCVSGTVANLNATGTNLQWYTDATGGTALDPTTALASGTYYVSQTLNNCESIRTVVNVSINTTANPTAADQSFCASGTVSNLTATGTNLQWYTAATGGTALAPTTALASGTYYVSQTLNTCESTRTAVIVTIITSSVDTVSDIQLCNGENMAGINFSGSNSSANYSWTNDNTDIGLAASGNGNIASFTATNTTTTDISATITVTPTVAAGTVNLVANGGFETNDLTGWSIFGYAGTSGCDQGFATYSGNYDPCGLSSMACSGTPLDFTAPQGTYGISASFDGQGPINKELRQSITLPVNLSQANLHFNDEYYVDLQDFCATCTGVRVLDVNILDATGTNILATLYNLMLTPNSNYCQAWTPKNLDVLSALQPYAGQNVILSYEITIPEAFTGPGFYALDDVQLNVNSECSGTPTSFVITVKPTPTAPTVTDQTFCNAATVGDLIASGTNVQWYTSTTGGTALDLSTALSSSTYYASQMASICESPRASSIVTVNVTPDVTGNAAQTLADNQTVADIVVSPTNVAWYPSLADALANTNQIPNGTFVTQGSTYYAVQTINGCTSANPLAVTITVTLGTMSFEGNQIGIFPNPASTILNIRQTNGLIFDRISLFDVTGKLILVQYQNTNQINVENLAEGMYMIEASSENSKFRSKFIKK